MDKDKVLKIKYGFDLYGRHKMTELIVNICRKDNLPMDILDVGGLDGIIKEFLTTDEIAILDPRVKDSKADRIYNGDATDMQGLFEENRFDIVTSHDVFEHIHPERRIDFVKEKLRVSRNLIILSAPFDSKSVVLAEGRVNHLFKSMHDRDHPWLIEHVENGLPSEQQLEDYLNDNKLDYIKLSNNRLKYWVISFYVTFILEANLDVTRSGLLQDFNTYYNSHIFPHDFGEESYRKIYIISKKGFSSELRQFIVNLQAGVEYDDIREFNVLIDYYFRVVSDVIIKAKALRDDRIDNLSNALVEGRNLYLETYERIDQMSGMIMDKENHIRNIESELLEKCKKIDELQLSILSSRSLMISRAIRKSLKIFTKNGVKYLFRLSGSAVRILRAMGLRALLLETRRYIKRHIHGQYVSTFHEYSIRLRQNVIGVDEYSIWLKNNAVTENDYEIMRADLECFDYKPLISVVIPVYNVDAKWLRLAVASVRNQVYTNWELCIVDDASTKKHIKPLLEQIKQMDERIKVEFYPINQHISLTSNEGVEMASGEFVTFLDNDDEISRDALYEFVKALNKNRDLDFIYSDEDQITSDGERVNPTFKPDWSPDTSLSMMYTTHLSLFRKSIIDEIGGFRRGYEGSQDYDLLLRFVEKTSPSKIHHITKILYHWRRLPGSTALNYFEKPYAREAARRSLMDAIERRGLNSTLLDGLTPTSFRIKRQIIGNPKVSIIIPTHNGRDLVKACIESIERKTQGVDYEVIVVDNNSNETKSLEYLKQVEKRHLVLKYQKPFNFSAINNFAVQYASGEHILFLNNDIEVINEKWLESLLEYSQLPEIGAVGCKLIYPNNTIQHAGVILGIGGVAGHSHKGFPKDAPGYMDRIQIAQNITAVTGACLMIKKALFEEVGGFNEKDLAVAFNDVEFCIKLHDKGYQNIYTPFAQLYHYESVSRGNEDTPEKMARFEREAKYMIKNWSKYLNRDPNYNPNLTHVRENFGLNIE